MNGFTYIIKLAVTGSNAFAKVSKLAANFSSQIKSLNANINDVRSRLINLNKDGARAFSSMRSSVSGFIAQVGVAALALNSLNTAVDLSSAQRAVTFTSGAEAANNLAFLKSEIETLKLPIKESLDGFKTLSGSMMGTGIAADDQRAIFHSLAEASTVMGLSAQDTQLAMLAVGQIASKGKVSMEELRGQLGERIPGAFGIAARAMGVSNAEFEKMVEKGLDAKAFLPAFAKEMHNTFGTGVQDAVKGPRAAFNEFNNSMLLLKNTIGTQLLPAATQLIQGYFIPAVDWIGRNVDVLSKLGVVIASVYGAYKVYNIVAGISQAVTTLLTGELWAFNAALWANPITWVVAGIIAFGAAIVIAWNYSEGFRNMIGQLHAALSGLWEVVQPLVEFIGGYWAFQMKIIIGFFHNLWQVIVWVDNAIKPLRDTIWNLLVAIKDAGMWIWENLIKPFTMVGKIVSALEPLFKKAGVAIGENFSEGWNKGMSDFSAFTAVTQEGNLLDKFFGVAGAGSNLTGGAAPAGGNPGAPGANASSLANSISSGGQKNITINVNKLVERLELRSENLNEGLNNIEREVTRVLLQVLNSANQAQTSNG